MNSQSSANRMELPILLQLLHGAHGRRAISIRRGRACGKDWEITGQPPVKMDRVLRNGDTVRLGGMILTGYNTPGHTKGSTTWVTTLVESGQAYLVAFPDGAGFQCRH